jgi:predicted ATPase
MPPAIRRVVIRNYKSIAKAAVDLSPLTVLVGPNGSGKSNFVDALAFVQECLSAGIELAAKDRGGMGAVRRKSAGRRAHVAIRLELNLADGVDAAYEFEVAAPAGEEFRVSHELCSVSTFMAETKSFEVRDGRFTKPIPGIRPRLQRDRLALYAASGVDEFRPVYDFLTAMRFYAIVPDRIRELQEPDPGEWLKRDGSNAAAVLRRLKRAGGAGDRYDRLCRLLSSVAEGITSVECRSVGRKETLEFRHDIGQNRPGKFDALSMSDGTLRVLGLLLALYQPSDASVVAVEEPEATVHPAAAEVVTEVLIDTSADRQVIATTHSPDVLDYKGLAEDQIRAVTMQQGRTIIARLAQGAREAISKRLYTPGELLRADELGPDVEEAERALAQSDVSATPGEGGGSET